MPGRSPPLGDRSKGWATNRSGAFLLLWGGHSLDFAQAGLCPPLLTLLFLPRRNQKIKVKSDGQECPSHMNYFNFVTVTSS